MLIPSLSGHVFYIGKLSFRLEQSRAELRVFTNDLEASVKASGHASKSDYIHAKLSIKMDNRKMVYSIASIGSEGEICVVKLKLEQGHPKVGQLRMECNIILDQIESHVNIVNLYTSDGKRVFNLNKRRPFFETKL